MNENVKIPVLDIETDCSLCKKDHKKNGLVTFEGAYGKYCVPIKKLNAFKSRVKNSQKFRNYLSIDEVPEDQLFNKEAWKNRHRYLDSDPSNTTCVHAISGGCFKCYPDSYCGSPGFDQNDPLRERY